MLLCADADAADADLAPARWPAPRAGPGGCGHGGMGGERAIRGHGGACRLLRPGAGGAAPAGRRTSSSCHGPRPGARTPSG